MTMYTAFGRFSGGDLQFVEYDYPNEAAFRQDLGGNGFAAKYILPTDWIKKYNWDWWVDRNGQKYRYGPNYTKLASKFKKCVKWYEENKDNLPDQITSFYDAAKLWDDYDIYWANAISKPYQSLEDYINQMTQPKDEGTISEYIDEVKSQLLPENTNTNLKAALLGKNPNVYTVAIGTPEDPMGKGLTPEENNILRTKFQRMLHDGNYNYTKIKGKFDNNEHSYVIYNVSLDTMMMWMGELFNQKSFIFIEKDNDDPENGTLMSYWEKDSEDPKAPYHRKQVRKHIKNMKDAQNYFSSLHGFKWQIPFNFDDNGNAVQEDTCQIVQVEGIEDPFVRLSRIHTESERTFLKEFTQGKRVGMSAFYDHQSLYHKKPSPLLNN